MNELYARCEAQLPEFMKLWERLVNIDCGTGTVPGLIEVAGILEDRLKRSGFTVTRHPAPGGDHSLVGTRGGKGGKSILFMAHMDTVFPPGTAAERPFTVNGDWAHGPGVSDCKAGVATIISGLDLLKDFDGFGTISVLFNCDEEIGSPHSGELVKELARTHDYVLSYEPGGVNDKVTVARKGSGKIHVTVRGKQSHAGSAPEEGRNAFMELVWQVGRMAELADPARKTSVNFTKCLCGDRLNVIPDKAEAWADVRVTMPGEVDRLKAELTRLASEPGIEGTSTVAELTMSQPPFPRNAATDDLAALAASVYGEIGRDLPGIEVGGAGDANTVASVGGKVLDSMGPAKGGPNHCPEEKAHIPTVVPRIYLLARMVQELGKA